MESSALPCPGPGPREEPAVGGGACSVVSASGAVVSVPAGEEADGFGDSETPGEPVPPGEQAARAPAASTASSPWISMRISGSPPFPTFYRRQFPGRVQDALLMPRSAPSWTSEAA